MSSTEGDPPSEAPPSADGSSSTSTSTVPPPGAAIGPDLVLESASEVDDDAQVDTANPTEPPDENVVRVDFRRGARVADTAGPAADEKLRVFRELVALGMVMVTLDSRRPGVNVPSRLAGDAQLNLNFSHRFGVPDFSYDDKGVRSTLTFGGHPFFCDVPWGAVWGLRSHVDSPDQVTVFHDALPEELLAMLPQSAREQLARAQQRRAAEKASEKVEPVAPPKVLEGASGRGDDAAADVETAAVSAERDVDAASTRPRGGLRLVRAEPPADDRSKE